MYLYMNGNLKNTLFDFALLCLIYLQMCIRTEPCLQVLVSCRQPTWIHRSFLDAGRMTQEVADWRLVYHHRVGPVRLREKGQF